MAEIPIKRTFLFFILITHLQKPISKVFMQLDLGQMYSVWYIMDNTKEINEDFLKWWETKGKQVITCFPCILDLAAVHVAKDCARLLGFIAKTD